MFLVKLEKNNFANWNIVKGKLPGALNKVIGANNLVFEEYF